MEITREDLFVLEHSLKNFFLKEKSRNVANDENLNFKLMKYRGLTLEIDIRNLQNILFVVKIGMLEASFSIRNGERVGGSLGGDEKIVEKWFLWGNTAEAFTLVTQKRKKKKVIYTGRGKNTNDDVTL